jgi:hypothetical protein
LSSLGAAHPERIAGLIYVEAGYPYAFRSRDGPTMKEFLDANAASPQAPTPGDTNLTGFGALHRWDARTFGFQMPESEFRQTWDSTADGRPVKPGNASGFAWQIDRRKPFSGTCRMRASFDFAACITSSCPTPWMSSARSAHSLLG